MVTEAQRKAVAKYDKGNTKSYHLKLNSKTDADIIKHLSTVGNVQGYIKHLIRADAGLLRWSDLTTELTTNQ